MGTKDQINLEFGTPEHGWLPTIFKYKDFELDIEISDVPLDPMVQLCDALIQLNKGIKVPERVIWHLEPYCYYLQLEMIGTQYKAVILESNEFDSPTTITKEIIGNFDTVILPLYRGLKNFWLQKYKHPHWEELEPKRMEELTRLIKEKMTR